MGQEGWVDLRKPGDRARLGTPDETWGLFKDVSWGGTVGGAGVDPGEAGSAQLLLAFPQADGHRAGGHLLKYQGHPHATHDPAGRVSCIPLCAHLWQPPHWSRLTLCPADRDMWPDPEGHRR